MPMALGPRDQPEPHGFLDTLSVGSAPGGSTRSQGKSPIFLTPCEKGLEDGRKGRRPRSMEWRAECRCPAQGKAGRSRGRAQPGQAGGRWSAREGAPIRRPGTAALRLTSASPWFSPRPNVSSLQNGRKYVACNSWHAHGY